MKKSPNRSKDAARGISNDMSPEAVAHRVRIMDQLWEAARHIRAARLQESMGALSGSKTGVVR